MAIQSYQKFFVHLGQLFNLETFIETGTADGTTLDAVRLGFKNVYSIELTRHRYESALRRFAGMGNVHLRRGDSAVALRQLLGEIPDTRTLFWLDAHFHGTDGRTSAGEPDPLAAEVAAIIELRPNALVAIDDQQDDSLRDVIAAGVDLSGWRRVFDGVRMVLLFKEEGGYYLPPFEG